MHYFDENNIRKVYCKDFNAFLWSCYNYTEKKLFTDFYILTDCYNKKNVTICKYVKNKCCVGIY